MTITIYEAMNEKIADIIAIDGTPSSLYASAYIKDLRAENARLKGQVDNLLTELGQSKSYIDGLEYEKRQSVKEFAEGLKDVISISIVEYPNDKSFYYNNALTDVINKIDNIITKLYGADE